MIGADWVLQDEDDDDVPRMIWSTENEHVEMTLDRLSHDFDEPDLVVSAYSFRIGVWDMWKDEQCVALGAC